MKSFQVLEAIFRGKVKRLADAWGVKETSAAKFLRDPDNSGARNPLDRVCRTMDEAFIANRSKAGLFYEYIRQYWLDLIGDDRRGRPWNPREVAGEILQTSTRAVRALAIENKPPAEQLQSLVEARHVLDEAILQLEILNGGEESH